MSHAADGLAAVARPSPQQPRLDPSMRSALPDPGTAPAVTAADHRPWPSGSVIVPSHGGAQRLPILLDALCHQDFTEPWEVVVVVDGVVDETPDLLADYATRLPLRSLVADEPQGPIAALNAGFGAARGEVLIRAGDDLTPEESFVARHVAWHEGREDLAVIGMARDLYPYTAFARSYGIEHDEEARQQAYSSDEDALWTLWGPNSSLHRGAWARVGGFDLGLPLGHDADFGWRLREAGIRFLVDPELETERRSPPATAADRVARAFSEGAARKYVELAHPGVRWPDPEPAPSRWHTTSVRFVARRLRTPERFQRAARALDRSLPRMPQGMGHRSVEILEDSARRAGHLRVRPPASRS